MPLFIPVGESLDFKANDQLSGLTEAQCGNLSSTGCRNFKPCGPHMTSGLNKVSPARNHQVLARGQNKTKALISVRGAQNHSLWVVKAKRPHTVTWEHKKCPSRPPGQTPLSRSDPNMGWPPPPGWSPVPPRWHVHDSIRPSWLRRARPKNHLVIHWKSSSWGEYRKPEIWSKGNEPRVGELFSPKISHGEHF